MPSFTIDGKSYQTGEGKNLLETALSLGLDLPYFCWHPALDSVGACRQCAVKQYRDEHDTRGRIVMACMTAVTEGARFSIIDPEAREFRTSVAEWLMTNHPHDCPVCDEGGECHLQDMTLMTGQNYRRFRFRKRTFRNQNLGPFINHEMNRCITCYRCVRFYDDYAGGHDLSAMAIHNAVYFGRHADGRLENEFSGNLVEICPTGVFTDKRFKKNFTRKWDLQTAPSVCNHCGLGCNTIPGERYGTIRRIRNRFNYDVNGYFLCDRGRYGFEFVNSDKRIRRPLLHEPGTESPKFISSVEALNRLQQLLTDSQRIVGVGSPRASLESNFALKSMVPRGHFIDGTSTAESALTRLIADILRGGPVPTASLHDIESADAILILGEDLTNTAPIEALAVRQIVRRQHKKLANKAAIPEWNDAAVREYAQTKTGPVFVVTPMATKLDEIAEKTFRSAPDELARLGFAIAHEIDDGSPAVPDAAAGTTELAKKIAARLREAEHPVIVSGTSQMNRALIEAAANIAWALHKRERNPSLSFVVPECDSLGVALLDPANLDKAFRMADEGMIDVLIVVENDLYRRASRERIDRLFNAVGHLVVLDSLETETTRKAEIVLPSSTFAEGSGTLVNSEGRAQRFFQVYSPRQDIRESWRWLASVHAAADGNPRLHSLDAVGEALAAAMPVFKDIVNVAPNAGFTVEGLKIPRETHRYSGRTAMNANISVHEPKPPDDPDTPLSYSMEGYPGEPPASLEPFFWAPGWNSIQALNKHQVEVGGPLHNGPQGIRILHPANNPVFNFFAAIPSPIRRTGSEFLLIPIHRIFGSEELSSYSPGISEATSAVSIALNGSDAATMHVTSGTIVEVAVGSVRLHLQAVVTDGIPEGIAGVPAGFSSIPFLMLPAAGTITGGGGA